jgi:hypothetical protein
VTAVQVSEATVVVNRTARGELALLAQAPTRFRGTVSKSGNELVSLAFHEQGYSLRYKLDVFPVGYYSGPPAGCAVRALLGVDLEPRELVAFVLGGGPVLAAPYEVLAQGWDGDAGYEKLTVRNAAFVQELWFAWESPTWRFAGASRWVRDPVSGGRGTWLWSVEHDRFESIGAVRLPGRTRVRTPGRRRDNLLAISYGARDVAPDFAIVAPIPVTDEPGSVDDPAEPNDGGWEDEGEWEDPDAPAAGEQAGEQAGASPTGAANGDGSPRPTEEDSPERRTPSDRAKESHEPSTPDREVSAAPPRLFVVDPSGLTIRGDLCRQGR